MEYLVNCTENVKILPLEISPLLIIEEIVITSIFPPEISETTFYVYNVISLKLLMIKYLILQQLIYVFQQVIEGFHQFIITYSYDFINIFLIYSNGVSPICLTAVPSAIVLTSLNLTS